MTPQLLERSNLFVKFTRPDPATLAKAYADLDNYTAERQALEAIGSSVELKYFPSRETAPLHAALAKIDDIAARVEFIKSNFDSLAAEAEAHPAPAEERRKPKPSAEAWSRKPDSFQAAALSAAARFDPSPLEYLEHFETIADGPEKRYFWGRHKDVIQIGFEERRWRQIRAEAEQIEQDQIAVTTGFSAQLSAIANPIARQNFIASTKPRSIPRWKRGGNTSVSSGSGGP